MAMATGSVLADYLAELASNLDRDRIERVHRGLGRYELRRKTTCFSGRERSFVPSWGSIPFIRSFLESPRPVARTLANASFAKRLPFES